MEAVYMASAICLLYMAFATGWERLSMGEEALALFHAAGEPHWQIFATGFPVSTGIVALLLSGKLWAGCLRSSAEAAGALAIESVEPAHTGFLLTLWEGIEASWNGVTSPRVVALSQRRAKAGAAKLPVRDMPSGVCHCVHVARFAAQNRAEIRTQFASMIPIP